MFLKTFKNNKGFTLIELLAVIVVLAIVMLLAMSTILPYMNKARESAFAVEATAAVEAASNEMTMIAIGTHRHGDANLPTGDEANYKQITGGYCFSLKKLVDLSWWDKSPKAIKANNKGGDYEGYVVVKPITGSNNYTYHIVMRNTAYYVDVEESEVDSADVKDSTTIPENTKFDCSAVN